MNFKYKLLLFIIISYSTSIYSQNSIKCLDNKGLLFEQIEFFYEGKSLGNFSTEEHWKNIQNSIPYLSKLNFKKTLFLDSSCDQKWLLLPLIRYPHHWIWDGVNLGQRTYESILFLTPGSHTLEIEIDNRTMGSNQTKGGIRSKFEYFDQVSLVNFYIRRIFTFVIESFVLSFIGIFFLFFFLQRKKDRGPLYLSLFCFVVSIYALVTSPFIYTLFPFINYSYKFKMEASLEFFFHLVHIYLMQSFFPSVFTRIWIVLFNILVYSIVLIFLFLPEPQMSIFYKYSLILHPILGSLVVFRMAKALVKKLPFSRIVFLGLFILLPSIFQDSWSGFSTEVELIPYTFPIALLFLILVHSLLLAKKFAIAEREANLKWELQEELALEKKERKEEKESIVRKLHDELGADLDLLLQSISTKDKPFIVSKIKDFLVRFKSLVLTVRASASEEVPLLSTIHSHLERLKNLDRYTINFESNIQDEFLTFWQKENLLAIFYEVVTNLNKYDKFTHLRIVLNQKHEKIVFFLSSNGKGFSEKEILSKMGHGIGLESIRVRTKAIQGKKRQLQFHGGSAFLLVFPLNR